MEQFEKNEKTLLLKRHFDDVANDAKKDGEP